MPKPSHTILLILPNRLVRADMQGAQAPKVASLYRSERPDVNDAASLVETALGLGPKPAGRVWVLSTELWTQTLRLSAAAATDLAGEELNQALSYEAGSLSGISVIASALGAASMGVDNGEQVFWITQGTANDRDRVEELLRRKGTRLCGFAHPAGLPGALLGDGEVDSFQRIELWQDLVVCVHGDLEPNCRIEVNHIDPQYGNWREAVEAWRQKVGEATHREMLNVGDPSASEDAYHQDSGRQDQGYEDSGHQDPGKASSSLIDLEDEETLKAWLAAWSSRLMEKETGVPVIKPPSKPLSAGIRSALAAVLALVFLALCLCHHVWTNDRTEAMKAETVRLKEPADTLNRLKKESQGIEKKLDVLREDLQETGKNCVRLESTLDAHRKRLVMLMRFLAEGSGPDFSIDRIDTLGGDLILEGLCMTPYSTDPLINRLEDGLNGLGWEVLPAQKQSQGLLTNGGPWNFKILLNDAPLEITSAPSSIGVGKKPDRIASGRRETP